MPHTNIESRIRQRARGLRKAKTRGEEDMWNYLRSFRPFGARFRREAPIGKYVVDFAWLSARIVIEVDGGSHDLPGRAEQDRARDAFLRSQGFEVVRVRDAEIVGNTSDAFARIEAALRPHLRADASEAGFGITPPRTPPHEGEGGMNAELRLINQASPRVGGERVGPGIDDPSS